MEGDTDATQCREKIQSFLQGSLRSRPDVDLNTYYVLALNDEVEHLGHRSAAWFWLEQAFDARDAEESG